MAAFFTGDSEDELDVAVRAAAVTQKVSPTLENVRPYNKKTVHELACKYVR